MKIAVTGGAGFIGSNFVFYMLREHPEDTILCVDVLTYAGNLETLAPVMQNPRFRFVKADIADRAAMYALFESEKPDIVVNFAAESHVDRSIENPAVFLQTNVMGTQVLLDACRKYGVAEISPGFHRLRYTAICRWIARICFSRSRRRCTHPARILRRRRRRICFATPIPAPMGCRSPSAGVRTTMVPISSRKN